MVNHTDKYSPICVSNICSKIVEATLLNRREMYLQKHHISRDLSLNTEQSYASVCF